MPVYQKFGNPPARSVDRTNRCSVCEPTSARVFLGDLAYDSERDARMTATNRVLQRALLANQVPEIWGALWNRFQCTNPECAHKRHCGNRPTYVDIGAEVAQLQPPAGNFVWVLFVSLAREIQCVPRGGGEDVTPEVPELEPLPSPSGPAPGPSGPSPAPSPAAPGDLPEFTWTPKGLVAGRPGRPS